ncbi:vacuolar amino acid transporter 1-like [Dorcoceras hygrometricum]|uniref:Vacuolar amino acid transporter 1-like n=1 Tax=Dorcoceras hygrometricum TaxID=472368 RepID=A0A2Z7CG04_9LAMI|nr:vacuolar amino acid transporter 1-like [Dorcoceras hygrometricum]
MNEIKLLEKSYDELEDQNMRRGLNEKEFVVENHEKSDETIDKENKCLEGSHKEDKSDDERDCVRSNENNGGSDVAASKVEEMSIFQSTIVDNWTSVDHVKNRKGLMFVTLPRSTPKWKRKVTKQPFVDVDQESSTLREEKI